MAAPSTTLVGGLRAFDHDMTVGGESILTLELYMEDDVARLMYCPSGESIFGRHSVKRPPLVDHSLPYGSLSRPLATSERVFFLHCPNSFENEDVVAGPETFALQSALRVANQPSLPRTLADDLLDKGIVRNLHAPDTTLDTPLLFLFGWTTLLLGRYSRTLHNAGVYYGLWVSIFQYSCDASVVQAFLDAWSPKTNTLITCQGELSITLLDMDRIFGLPISGQFYDEFRIEDNAVPIHDTWTAWHAAYEKGSSGEEKDYDSDRSHPRRRRPKGKQQVGAPSANKKREPLTTFNGASASKKKPCVEAQPASFPSPLTFLPPISETEPPQASCPPMEPPEPEPHVETVVGTVVETVVETVQISSSPEADLPALIQTFLLGASDIQEEVLPLETEVVVVAFEDIEVAEAPAATSSMGLVLEVAPALTQLEASPPPVREVTPVIQEAVIPLPLPAPPTPASITTPLVTSSQQL
ncbi:hypothetical protein H6P81_010129 [Aristolochia fimbriata]|uniref:Aminotransferase-like plant mobile domain-containing protein n=1 Tax=Aristolochia fimbriata TaxID=158543 RepID=A0AAV7ENR4_ARIFI|nr:hypothetical protein H6P81_010129 [Aristolochia fimbriata]